MKTGSAVVKQFQKVIIGGAQPSQRLDDELCFSEGFLEASVRVSQRFLQGFGGFWESPRLFLVASLCSGELLDGRLPVL